jgi:hypothetical protein
VPIGVLILGLVVSVFTYNRMDELYLIPEALTNSGSWQAGEAVKTGYIYLFGLGMILIGIGAWLIWDEYTTYKNRNN